MKILRWPFLAVVLVFTGCTLDRTLETLVPKEALAIVLVDHPDLVLAALGPGSEDLPWKSLDGGKPWAAAALPANPPGFFVALALAGSDQAWSAVVSWAKEHGGLNVTKLGTYAVLTSPGLSPPVVLDPDRRFDLERVRAGGDPVAVYLDVPRCLAARGAPPALGGGLAGSSWLARNLAGLRLGLSARNGGLEVRAATDWSGSSTMGPLLKSLETEGSDPGPWTGFLPLADGFGVSLVLSSGAMAMAAPWISDPTLARRWSALVPLLGPRWAWAVKPAGEGDWSWGMAIETRDPQGIRQALRTLVASGELQANFSAWGLDPDTPVIYQDKPTRNMARLTWGHELVYLGYRQDRVAASGGAGAETGLSRWLADPVVPAQWAGEIPAGASLAASGSLDGLGARGSLEILGDGNLEARVWTDAQGLKAWETRLPQAALSWLSGAGGWTRWEP